MKKNQGLRPPSHRRARRLPSGRGFCALPPSHRAHTGLLLFLSLAPLLALAQIPQADSGANTLPFNNRRARLDTVTVLAARPLFRATPAGSVLQVDGSILSKGSTALQLLERSPGIYIDHQYGNIQLNGRSGLTVLLNGRTLRLSMAQLLSFLSSLPADQIERIELLSAPSARYDAEGSAGIINIVLKADPRLGTHGSLSATAGYGWRDKESLTGNLSRNTARWRLHGSYTFSHDRSYGDWGGGSTQNEPQLGGPAAVTFKSSFQPDIFNQDAQAGAEWQPGARDRIGLNLTWSNSRSRTQTGNLGIYHIFPDSLLIMQADIGNDNHWSNGTGSLYWSRKLRRQDQLDLDLQWLDFRNDNPTEIRSVFSGHNGEAIKTGSDTTFSPWQRGTANTRVSVGAVKADYQGKLDGSWRWEGGLKASFSSSRNQAGIQSLVNNNWVNRGGAASGMRVQEQIGAGYLSIQGDPDRKQHVTIGLRFEYTHTALDSTQSGAAHTDRRLAQFFPNLQWSWKPSDRAEWQLAYSRRITRPSYNDLASSLVYIDPLSVGTGNPLLQPTITDLWKAAYTWRAWSFSLLYSHDDHPILHYQLTKDPSGKLIAVSPVNMDYLNSFTAQTNIPLHPFSWWNMNYGLVGGWRQFRLLHTKEQAEKAYWAWSVTAAETFRLPAGFSLELSGWYNGPSWDGSKRVDEFWAVDGGLKKELGRSRGMDWGTLQLTVSDIFQSIRITSHFGALTEEVFDLRSSITYHPESWQARIVRLSWTVPLGHAHPKNPPGSNPPNSASEEQSRIRRP